MDLLSELQLQQAQIAAQLSQCEQGFRLFQLHAEFIDCNTIGKRLGKIFLVHTGTACAEKIRHLVIVGCAERKQRKLSAQRSQLLRHLHITGEQFLLGPQKSQALRFQFQLEPAFFMLGCCPDRIC